MAVSKAQVAHVNTICTCGCGEAFRAFPVYRPKSEGGGLTVPLYKRGHHPNCRKTQTGNAKPWNAGLKKSDHPSIERMGFQFQPKRNPDWLDLEFDHVAFAKLYKNIKDAVRGSKKAYSKFREAILKRDMFSCRDCRSKLSIVGLGKNETHIHHVVPVRVDPLRLFDDENVVSLCRDCHLKHHGKTRRRKNGSLNEPTDPIPSRSGCPA